MGFFSGVGRIIIVLLNIVFVIVSLVLLASGLVLKFFPHNDYIKSTEDQLKAALKTLLEGTGQGTDALSNFSLAGIFETVAICLIVIGAFLLFVGFCGCCGAFCKFQTLLIIYASILIFLLVGELVVIILLYASPTVKDMVKKELTSSLTNYHGLAGTNVESLLWNAAMIEFKCCGVNNYRDFASYAPNWDKTPEFGGTATNTLDTPVACCKTIPKTQTEANLCAYLPHSGTSNYDKGCFDSIWDKMFDNPTMLGIVLTVAFAIQVLLIVFTILMYKENKNNKVSSVI